MVDAEDETEGNDGADEVAGDHDLATVEPIEDDASQRACDEHRDGAGNQHAADEEAAVLLPNGHRENGDVVEVISDFADQLTAPEEAVIVIGLEQLGNRDRH